MNKSAISVVICAYTEERWSDILAAVASVRVQTLQPAEIILVIDHNPRLLARARAALPEIMILENTHTRGLSGARNTAIHAATGTFVAFLDDDAVAEPEWLERLYAHCRSDTLLGAGGWVEPRWTSGRPGWFPDEFLWVVGCSYRGLPSSAAIVRNPFGGCSCVRRDIYEVIGGYRSEIGRVGTRPLGCEETELSIRATQRWPERVWMYEPSARIHHTVPSSRARWGYFLARCFAEGQSKAWLAWHLGSGDGLASERTYVTRTLPAGVMRGLASTLRGDRSGVARAAAIVLGLAWTVAGYGWGTLAQMRQSRAVARMTAEVGESTP